MCIPNPAPYANVRPWHRRLAFRRAASFYLAISPWLIGFILMSVIPLIVGLLTSFTNYDGLDVSYRWVGLDNYEMVPDHGQGGLVGPVPDGRGRPYQRSLEHRRRFRPGGAPRTRR